LNTFSSFLYSTIALSITNTYFNLTNGLAIFKQFALVLLNNLKIFLNTGLLPFLE